MLHNSERGKQKSACFAEYSQWGIIRTSRRSFIFTVYECLKTVSFFFVMKTKLEYSLTPDYVYLKNSVGPTYLAKTKN